MLCSSHGMQPGKVGSPARFMLRQADPGQIADVVFVSQVTVWEDESADLLAGATFWTLALQAIFLHHSTGAIYGVLLPRQKPTSVSCTSQLGRRAHNPRYSTLSPTKHQ